jgi:hypothetical protein
MVMLAEADLVVSETEVAVTVTVAGVGTAAGAENVVAVPLGVVAGLKLPHCELPQVTDQVTPALALSLATVAVRAALVVAATDVGGLVSVTAIGALGTEIVMVAEADLVESVTEVAVTATVAGLGAEAGAVNFVVVPLPVEAAEKLPHCALLQVTDHLTPALVLSLPTIAVRLMLEPVSVDDGG